MYPKSELKKAVSRLVNTSVEDCHSTLPFESDIDVLIAALLESIRLGHKTRVRMIRSRIRQLAPSHLILKQTA